MARKPTQADRIEAMVKECHVALYGGEKEGKPVRSLILRTDAIEAKVFPPLWKVTLKEGRLLIQMIAAGLGIHKGL